MSQTADRETVPEDDQTTPENVTPFPNQLALREIPDDHLPSTGLLSFYDRLRERISEVIEEKGGNLASHTIQALLLVPDVFILLVRLSLDKEVPKGTRVLIGSALAYFMLPADFLPELFLGPMGFLDDLILGLMVLAQSFGKDLEPYTAKHWSGSQSIRKVLEDVLGAADSLVGHNIYGRLQDVLAKRGFEMDATPTGATASAADSEG